MERKVKVVKALFHRSAACGLTSHPSISRLVQVRKLGPHAGRKDKRELADGKMGSITVGKVCSKDADCSLVTQRDHGLAKLVVI